MLHTAESLPIKDVWDIFDLGLPNPAMQNLSSTSRQDTFYSHVPFCILWFRLYSSKEQSRCLKGATMVRRPQMSAGIVKTPRCHVKQSLNISLRRSSCLGRRIFRICVHLQINVHSACRICRCQNQKSWNTNLLVTHGSAYMSRKSLHKGFVKLLQVVLKDDHTHGW